MSGLVAALVTAPLTGLAVAVALALVLRRPGGRLLLGGVAVACLLIALVYVLISQGVDPKSASGAWPSGFGAANAIVWVGLAFLGADAVAELVLGRREKPEATATPSG
ncbi:MAG: hypothetical protein JO368_10450 [Acidimicrobiales bacterium]|nr:hypothetical protein [Acidimicrobiales bacterium]